MFLTDDELKELTGICRGKDGHTLHQLQIDWLRKQGIPFYENARNRPVVVREVLTNRKITEPARPKWTPKVLSMG
ncbi:DUF4224 domain-containing protein [Advenella mimigardefordensis]|uniref:DUF4224 domain-containing protein n=1 Tax=Advenella mimigardefordensis TaxID=302406 RepID=UPI00046D60D4|nr:DUF4224 domain-containing protein [Advenella mimigardefordensis]